MLYGLETWTLLADAQKKKKKKRKKKKKDPGFRNQVHEETSPYLLSWSTRQTTGCRGSSTSLWVHRNLFWQPLRDGNLHGSGMSHATTASPKPSFRAHWRVGDVAFGRRNAGWTASMSGHPCPCQNCSQGPPATKSGRGSLLNRPSSPPDDPIGHGTEVK